MIQSSLELIQAIQSDYERQAQQIYLLKQIRNPKPIPRFIKKLVWLGKDLTYLAYRLVTLRRKHA